MTNPRINPEDIQHAKCICGAEASWHIPTVDPIEIEREAKAFVEEHRKCGHKMADKFECDSCKQILNPSAKAGSFELKEIGSDTLPHAKFAGKLDLCKPCFDKNKQRFIEINPALAPFRG